MSKLQVFDMQGSAVGDYDIADETLVLDRGEQVLHDALVRFRARQRAGTASTLSKGAVAGSNRKPWRQKGTGRARAGYRQSPIWRGGGVAFGPHPRSYGGKLNRKSARLAFQRALSEKVAAGQIKVLESLSLEAAKTRELAGILKSLEVCAPALVVTETVDDKLALAVRNLARIEVARAWDVNIYQLMRYPAIVATRAGLEVLKARLSAEGEQAE